ncbi:MAG: type IX secretion system membrane protein PorP/SprF [Cytophagaceae bacterium]|nr:type IX secretion system membrane protein PorP/SprF [Cytophagaceae bacterium]MDW8455871.1 type IX secretion system membrane protein PorP/SprF [Cytophagaceae bacterium]
MNLLTKQCANKLKIIIGLFAMGINVLSAQDIQFSQFYAVTPYQNPAFAGGQHALRGMVHARAQWPSIEAQYITGLFSIDNYFSKYNSGVGLMFIRDVEGANNVGFTNINALYSYELPVTKKLSVRAGLQGGYVSKYINTDGLYYPSQIDDNGNISGNIGLPSTRRNYADISAGLLGYSERVWGGFSAHHLNQPNQSLFGDKAKLPTKYALTTGVRIPISVGHHMAYLHDADNVSLTPTAHYKMQGKSDQLDIGCYLTYNQLMTGVWYRGIPVKRYQKGLHNNESLALSLGWLYNNWSFGYSYDFVVSKLSRARTGGAHEINITYVYHKSNKRDKPLKRLPCPDFHRVQKHSKHH